MRSAASRAMLSAKPNQTLNSDERGLLAGRAVCRLLMAATCFLWGTAQIAPAGAALDLAIGKVNAGDVSFVALCALLATTAPFRRHFVAFLDRCPVFVLFVACFTAFGIASAFTNAFARDLAVSDLIEVIRPLYYLLVVIAVCFFVRAGRIAEVLMFFPLGILAASTNNFLLVLSGEIEATSRVLQLYQRNVVGNLLAVSILFYSLAFYFGRQLISSVLVCATVLLVVFCFSKGAWVMALLGICCFAVVYARAARKGSLRKSVRVLTGACGAAVVIFVLLNVEMITSVLDLKIQQSFTDETTRSQSTVALRIGHVLSSLEIVAENPIFGVGVTNWEAANRENAYWLNDIFLTNDNPHNGFLYILSGMGIPALVAFFAIMMFPVLLLPRLLDFTHREAIAFGILSFGVLFVSGNFMLHILSHYFLWLLCGLTFGLALRKQTVAASRVLPGHAVSSERMAGL
jgi:O-antigen ligase